MFNNSIFSFIIKTKGREKRINTNILCRQKKSVKCPAPGSPLLCVVMYFFFTQTLYNIL